MMSRLKVSDFRKEVNPQLVLDSPTLVQAFFKNSHTLFAVTTTPPAITKYSFEMQESLLSIPLVEGEP